MAWKPPVSSASLRSSARVAACCACVLALLAGCTSVPVAHDTGPGFDDAAFAPPSETIDPRAVTALSPLMLAYIGSNISAEQKRNGRQRGLLSGLFASGQTFINYEATMTRTASEAFDARSGNCLSLVLMTGAFAKKLGLGVRYQWIHTWKAWSRDDELEYLHTHVNLVLLPPNEPHGDGVLVDFMPPEPNTVQHLYVVDEAAIVAMYMNNRAVELLAKGEVDRAYWWAKAAIHQDPGFLDAVNTLAVIYRAHGQLGADEKALRWLLRQEPDNLVALQNLATVLQAQGRVEEASVVSQQLRELMPVPPFHYYDLGQEALRLGQFQRAKDLFQKEMRRDAHYDRFHASLALAHYGLGEMNKAQAQMSVALEYSTTDADRAMYARMLAHLRAGEHP